MDHERAGEEPLGGFPRTPGHEDADPESWTHDPFGGELVGTRIYGRGARDMKGAVAATGFGTVSLLAHRQDLAGEVYVSGSVAEELFEGAALGQLLAEIILDGKATSLDIAPLSTMRFREGPARENRFTC